MHTPITLADRVIRVEVQLASHTLFQLWALTVLLSMAVVMS